MGRRGAHVDPARATAWGPGPATGRVDMLDAARGLAIVLVVLLHAADWLGDGGFSMNGWFEINGVLGALRMPVFFVASGMLGAKWLGAPWPKLFSVKVTLLLWVYLAWQPVDEFVGLIEEHVKGNSPNLVRMTGSLVLSPVRPHQELWFIWALAGMFVAARFLAARRIPPPVQLVATAALAAVGLSDLNPVGNMGWSGLACYTFFFLLGVHHRALLIGVSGLVSRLGGVTYVVALGWVLFASASAYFRWEHHYVGMGLLVRLIGLVAGLLLAHRLAHVRLLRYLGSRTLGIYVAHTPVIVVMVALLQIGRAGAWPEPVHQVLPLGLTLLAVPITLGLRALLSRTPGRLLYESPARATAAVARWCSARGARPAETERDRAGAAPPHVAWHPEPQAPAPLRSPYLPAPVPVCAPGTLRSPYAPVPAFASMQAPREVVRTF